MIICLVRWVLNFFIWVFFAHYCAIYSRIDAREYNPNINISEVQDRALKSRLQKADQVLVQSNLDHGVHPANRTNT